MKALSLRQPWASLVLSGTKTIENRTWRTSYRGCILIHAAREPNDPDRAPLPDAGRNWLEARAVLGPLPYGALIGHVCLSDIVQGADTDASPWAKPGLWHWLLRNPVAFEVPIPWRGLPGLFEVPEDLLDRSGRREPPGVKAQAGRIHEARNAPPGSSPPRSQARMPRILPPGRDDVDHSW